MAGLKSREHTEAKGKLRRGWISLPLRDFIANDMLIFCDAKVNINCRENQICSGRGCGEAVDCIFNRKPERSKSFQNGFVFN